MFRNALAWRTSSMRHNSPRQKVRAVCAAINAASVSNGWRHSQFQKRAGRGAVLCGY